MSLLFTLFFISFIGIYLFPTMLEKIIKGREEDKLVTSIINYLDLSKRNNCKVEYESYKDEELRVYFIAQKVKLEMKLNMKYITDNWNYSIGNSQIMQNFMEIISEIGHLPKMYVTVKNTDIKRVRILLKQNKIDLLNLALTFTTGKSYEFWEGVFIDKKLKDEIHGKEFLSKFNH